MLKPDFFHNWLPVSRNQFLVVERRHRLTRWWLVWRI